MPAPYRRFVHQQHPRGPGPATLRHLSRLRADQAHDPMPPNPVMAGCRNQTTGEPAGKTTGELVVVLEVPAVRTFEPATPRPLTSKITNPLRPPVHLVTPEPALRTTTPCSIPLRPRGATPSAGSRKDLLGFVEYDGPLQSKVHDEVGGRVWAIA